jgi:murein DD-endopeptidase MepM/ murein hydrolase activator NlpD
MRYLRKEFCFAMKKRFSLIIVTAIILMLLISVTTASAADLTIKIDNQNVVFTDSMGKPFIDENNRTQVPLRVTMETFGCQVNWDGTNKIATVTKDNITVQAPIGKSYILKNGRQINNDTEAVIKNNRTYLPIRIVLEAFGAQVNWNNTSNTCTVNSNGSSSTVDSSLIKTANLLWPVPNYYLITSDFYDRNMTHLAIDIAGSNIQGKPIVAAQDGEVTTMKQLTTSYGIYCIITHKNIKYNNNHLSTLYAHMDSINVSLGDTVKRGDVIGYVGKTGNTTGYHLHFEVRVGKEKVDPLEFF